jgi:hypothetical protein
MGSVKEVDMTVDQKPADRTADRESVAARLLAASAAHSYDPDVEIDWAAPMVPGRYYAPAHRLSLNGTPLWDTLSEDQRVELSKHEVASIASAGIWFEVLLMQMLLRHVDRLDPRSQHVQYALTEIGDECRHSVMFGRMIEAFGCPAYGPAAAEARLGRFLRTTAGGIQIFAAALVAEELLDALQREAMADETIQPLVRAVSRIHVVEEARHIRFAREELARQVAGAGTIHRAYARIVVARAAYAVARSLISPQVYASVGLDPAVASAAAWANPRFRATLAWAATKLVEYFGSLGLIAGPERRYWHRAALLPGR